MSTSATESPVVFYFLKSPWEKIKTEWKQFSPSNDWYNNQMIPHEKLPGTIKWKTCLPLFELPQPSSVPWKLCLILSYSRIMPKFKKTSLETDLSLTFWPFLPGLCIFLLCLQYCCFRGWCYVLDSLMPHSLLWTHACLWPHWLLKAMADPSPALWVHLVPIYETSSLRCHVRTSNSSSSSPHKPASLPLSRLSISYQLKTPGLLSSEIPTHPKFFPPLLIFSNIWTFSSHTQLLLHYCTLPSLTLLQSNSTLLQVSFLNTTLLHIFQSPPLPRPPAAHPSPWVELP